MASFCARAANAAPRSARASCQDSACSTSAPYVAVRPRHAAIAIAPLAAMRQQQQRLVSGVLARGIPVSGPGSASPSPSGGASGQVTSELMDSMRAKICEALETDTCSVADVYGDGRHVSIDVVSKLFEGKNSMQRQRMVYKAIWMELQETVHAVDSMSTKTPGEAAQ